MLEKERYKYYKIITPLYGPKNSSLIDFIKEVPNPELLDLVSSNEQRESKLGTMVKDYIERVLNKDDSSLKNMYY